MAVNLPGQIQHRQSFALHTQFENKYLILTGNGTISAALLDNDGNQLSSGVIISQSDLWRSAPSAAYSPETRNYLAVWYGSINDTATHVFGRLFTISTSNTIQYQSDEFVIGTQTSRMTAAPGIVYVPARREFVITWQGYESDAPGVFVQRISASGNFVGSTVRIAWDGSWHDEPSIAYNPDLDQFVVAYAYAGGTIEARVQLLNWQAQPMGSYRTLASAASVWATQITYNKHLRKYFVVWTDPSIRAAFLNSNASLFSSVFHIAPGFGGYEGIHYAFNDFTRTYLFSFQGAHDSANYVSEVDESGRQGRVVQSIEPFGHGNYGPRVVASTSRPEWLVSTSREYASTQIRRIQATSAP